MHTGCFILCLFVSTIAHAADESVTASPMVVDAAGRAIGYLAAHSCVPDQGEPQFAFISATGYAGCVSAASGRIGSRLVPPGSSGGINNDLGFVSPECSGQAMLCVNPSESMTGGFMVRTNPGIVYVSHGQLPEQLLISSELTMPGGGQACRSLAIPQVRPCQDALPFNSQELGVQSSNYRAPLRVSVIDDDLLRDVIFFDGVDPDGVWQ